MKMKFKVTKNEWPEVGRRMAHLKNIERMGVHWVRRSTERADQLYRHYLETQGRGEGVGPPLSSLTIELYRIEGPPDGSGIRNHIVTEIISRPGKHIGIMAVPKGQPGIVAKVQDRGCTIRVTPRMRSWFARRGFRISKDFIEIPARHSWEYSQKDARRAAKRDLKVAWRNFLK